jgi:Domain of unknown function (DUF4272)
MRITQRRLTSQRHSWRTEDLLETAKVTAMIENCAIYLPTAAVDFAALLPGGVLRKPNRYEFPTEAGRITVNIASPKDLPDHLNGLRHYVVSLRNTDIQMERALALIDEVQMILGVELPAPIAPDSAAFASLTGLFQTLGGFMFVNDSILTKDGFLVGPMTYPEPVMEPIATVQIDSRTQALVPEHMRQIRERTLAALAERGFGCAPNLPISERETVRPAEEIARRFAALGALYLYVSAPEDFITTEALKTMIGSNGLKSALTDEEAAILTMSRPKAHAEYDHMIGWKLENMWPLAWLFGFEPEPPFYEGQLSHDVINSMIAFLPGQTRTLAEFVTGTPLRPTAEIVELEDRFYCAHNAVRNAQLGHPGVPPDFDPLADGGAIHERRHALTWCLSPGVDWEETDLST